MKIIIDEGNTLVKIAIFDHDKIIELYIEDKLELSIINKVLKKHPSVSDGIISSVNKSFEINKDELYNKVEFIELNSKTKLPIVNLYKTKETLGNDRIAACVGANKLFPDSNVLVVDAGTAITIDVITDKNQFLGGNISPGIKMRFKALNKFTKQLPLFDTTDIDMIIGDTTETAIISGVQNSVVFEIEGYINLLKTKYYDLKVILTGGDSFFFDKKLKNTIFVEPKLVLIGLNTILEYNAEN